jgi:hypothetical protein
MKAQNRAESAAIRHEIDHLRHKTVAELKVRYAELFGEVSRSNHKLFLVRRIAWRTQALAEGDLSARARERALRLARDADLRLRAPQESSTITTAGRHRDSRLPAPGTILKRTFRDQSVVVRVLENGFQYEGAMYRSLSATTINQNVCDYHHASDGSRDHGSCMELRETDRVSERTSW